MAAKKAARTTASTGKAMKARQSDGATNAATTRSKAATGKRTQASKFVKTVTRNAQTQKVDKPTKASALDAAAQVLGESGQPMNCKEMIETMAAEGYWKSPAGKTPRATLYSALAREINAKGKDSRFKKAERGKFTLA